MTTHPRLWWIGLWVQAFLYIAAGINHFLHLPMYVSIMPPHWHDAAFWVRLTGVLEIAGGIGLLLPATRRWAAWGIVAMLVVYFDVHIYMLTHAELFAAIPVWLLWARLPLQFVLIAYAWVYVRPEQGRG
jgi:uncharacterized membrane protein